ncbi:Uncharacterised protein [Mycobacterium tuberculosis]|nr:Uncharacterised protein [Mycobacterium tuberculosis]
MGFLVWFSQVLLRYMVWIKIILMNHFLLMHLIIMAKVNGRQNRFCKSGLKLILIGTSILSDQLLYLGKEIEVTYSTC